VNGEARYACVPEKQQTGGKAADHRTRRTRLEKAEVLQTEVNLQPLEALRALPVDCNGRIAEGVHVLNGTKRSFMRLVGWSGGA